jgi:hypothetical protein
MWRGCHRRLSRYRRNVSVAMAVVLGAAVLFVTPPASATCLPDDDDCGGSGTNNPGACRSSAGGSITATPESIFLGQSVTLRWSASAPCNFTVRITGPGLSGEVVSASGSLTLTPSATGSYTFHVRITVAGVSVMPDSATLTVQSMPALPPVAAARNADGRLEYFRAVDEKVYWAPQRAPDGRFVNASTPGGSWPAMKSLAAEANADGRMVLFGVNGAGQIFQTAQLTAGTTTGLGPGTGSGWSAWSRMDGYVMSVAAARGPNGRIQIFATDAYQRVWHRTQTAPNSTTWSPWSLFATMIRQVAAETDAQGRLHLLGVDAAGQVWHIMQSAANSPAWSGWRQLPGGLKSIAVARNNVGRLQLFGVDTAGRLRTTIENPADSSFPAWTEIPFSTDGDHVAAETGADGRIELFGTDAVGPMTHRAQRQPGGWDWGNWRPLGQNALDPPEATCDSYAYCLRADVNGDGVSDAVAFAKSDRPGAEEGDIRVALSGGVNAYDPAQRWSDRMCVQAEACALADVDGDNRADAVVFTHSGPAAGNSVSVALSTGSGFASPAVWLTGFCGSTQLCLLADVNGDRKADAVALSSTSAAGADGGVWVALSRGGGFEPPSRWSDLTCAPEQQCMLGNVDGVLGADLIVLTRTAAGAGRAVVATAWTDRFNPAQVWSQDTGCVEAAACGLVDSNKDRKADLAVMPHGSTTTWVSVSTGTAFAARISQSTAARANPATPPSLSKTMEMRCDDAKPAYLRMVAAERQAEYIDGLKEFFGDDVFGANENGELDAVRDAAMEAKDAERSTVMNTTQVGDRCEFDDPAGGPGHVLIRNG